MEYRKLGRTGLNVSAIGLGTEHLDLSRENIEGVFRTAVDAGVNYIDIIQFNPGTGGGWDNYSLALRSHRDKLILAAHWAPSNHPLVRDSQRCFENVLARLCNDYAEVGMLSSINMEEQWEEAQKSLERLLRFKEQGRIGYIGVSSHFASASMKIINSGLIDVLMLPINLSDLISHNGENIGEPYQAYVKHGVGLVAMKPYWGGNLFSHHGKPSGITPTQCLAYVLSHPVSTTVPGVKNVEELRATLHYLEATDEEKDYHSAIANLPTVWRGQCVYCGHCRPCPQDIAISQVIKYTDWIRSGIFSFDALLNGGGGIQGYANLKAKASECTECGVCMERCPFEVDVIAKMREAVEIFETNAA